MIPFLIPPVVFIALALMATFATSVVLASVAAISSPFIITACLGALAAVCTFLLMASFAVAAFLAAVAAICITFFIITGLAVSHCLGFIDLAPLFRGLKNVAAKLTLPVLTKAATMGASVTGALAQYSRGDR